MVIQDHSQYGYGVKEPNVGRGTEFNPSHRFQKFEYEADPEARVRSVPTELFEDNARSIISYNTSPDIQFDASVNPYRGCEHGCAYCYARPFHEYLGWSAGLDFESKILVKRNAAELLRIELNRPSWTPTLLTMSGITDPYQPIERKLGITRQCLEVLLDFRNPVGIITKNHMVTRDADLLGELAKFDAATVMISLPTLDVDLSRILEPRTSTPQARLKAITELTRRGIPCSVFIAPVIPGLTDHEMPAIAKAAAAAGATSAHYVLLRLPGSVRGIFETWLDTHLPDRKNKIIHHLEDARQGNLGDDRIGSRMIGSGSFAGQIRDLFKMSARRAGLSDRHRELSTSAFRRPGLYQASLFEEL
jgi:DNA repair photolyase